MPVPDHTVLARWGLGISLATLILVLVGASAGTPERRSAPAREAAWTAGQPIPVAVHDGHARFRIPMASAGSECLVVVSSLSRLPGTFPVRLEAAAASAAPGPAVEPAALPRVRVGKHQGYHPAPVPAPPQGMPPRERVFSLLVRDGDVSSPSNYQAVRGRLRAVGQRVQVYVGADDIAHVAPELLEDLVRTFDERIFPTSARTVGIADDTDRDGRFSVLVSSWLSRLGNGRHAVDGFVRVTDFDPTFSAPFGNRCDMMYLSADLKPGPYLRTIVAHEYMHAVVFSQKSHRTSSGGLAPVEEEGWLDEALAHWAEDLHGFSRSNIDYRVSAFLSAPEHYQLVVEDYFTADLFRSHGNRGSTYLFLRWCVDQYGPELVTSLVQSRLRGVANLEAATGCPFPELYRRWSLALYMSGLRSDSVHSDLGPFRSLDLRGQFAQWRLAGPKATRVAAGEPAHAWALAGTSSHFIVVHGAAPGAVEVTVSGPPAAALQVTALPLPAGVGGLDLTVRGSTGRDGDLHVRASVRERNGQPVRLTSLAWEPLLPAVDPRVTGTRHGLLDASEIASSFGAAELPRGGVVHSRPIRLHGLNEQSGPVVLKVIGTDASGNRVAAWARINDGPPAPESEAGPPIARNSP